MTHDYVLLTEDKLLALLGAELVAQLFLGHLLLDELLARVHELLRAPCQRGVKQCRHLVRVRVRLGLRLGSGLGSGSGSGVGSGSGSGSSLGLGLGLA